MTISSATPMRTMAAPVLLNICVSTGRPMISLACVMATDTTATISAVPPTSDKVRPARRSGAAPRRSGSVSRPMPDSSALAIVASARPINAATATRMAADSSLGIRLMTVSSRRDSGSVTASSPNGCNAATKVGSSIST